MGGQKEQEAVQPVAPTAEQNAANYNTMLENQYQQQLKYAPLEAQQQFDLASQYALPYAQLQKDFQNELYPETAALQEQLAAIASERATGVLPENIQRQYQDQFRANLGTNVGSPIGADYVSRGMLGQQEDYNRYYQNLGMSLAGRQPLTQAQQPSFTNQMGQINPGQVMGFNQGIYGTQANIFNNQANIAQQQRQTNQMMPFMYMQGAGNLMQGVGSMGTGFGFGGKNNGNS